MLRIEPVDPRDPLRGDHLTFQYDISDVYASQFGYSSIKDGDTVYVPLEKAGKYKFWIVAEGIQKTKPIDSEKIFIKGKIVGSGSSPFDTPSMYYSQTYHIVYGIEDYFIPEGVGQGFSFWGQEVAARVSVGKNGDAVLKQIYVNDKPWP